MANNSTRPFLETCAFLNQVSNKCQPLGIVNEKSGEFQEEPITRSRYTSLNVFQREGEEVRLITESGMPFYELDRYDTEISGPQLPYLGNTECKWFIELNAITRAEAQKIYKDTCLTCAGLTLCGARPGMNGNQPGIYLDGFCAIPIIDTVVPARVGK